MTDSAKRERIKWTYGDIFAVPLYDGSFGVCQAAYDVLPHVVDCAFFSLRLHDVSVEPPGLNTKGSSLIGRGSVI